MGTDPDHRGALLARALAESPYLTTAQAARYLRIAERTMETMRSKEGGPIFRCHTEGRNIVYHYRDLDAWSDTRRRRSTKDDSPQGELPFVFPEPTDSPWGGNGHTDH